MIGLMALRGQEPLRAEKTPSCEKNYHPRQVSWTEEYGIVRFERLDNTRRIFDQWIGSACKSGEFRRI